MLAFLGRMEAMEAAHEEIAVAATVVPRRYNPHAAAEGRGDSLKFGHGHINVT
jgi:hypothetical protein